MQNNDYTLAADMSAQLVGGAFDLVFFLILVMGIVLCLFAMLDIVRRAGR